MLYCWTSICEIMYKILTQASVKQITSFHWCASIWGPVRQLAPVNLSPIGQPSNICKKTHQCANGTCYERGFLQLVCVHVCCSRERHFEDSMLPRGLICLSDKITAVLRKNPNIIAAPGFHKIPRIIYCACALRYWKITCIYTVCSQFKHYMGLVNLPHSSTCLMFP